MSSNNMAPTIEQALKDMKIEAANTIDDLIIQIQKGESLPMPFPCDFEASEEAFAHVSSFKMRTWDHHDLLLLFAEIPDTEQGNYVYFPSENKKPVPVLGTPPPMLQRWTVYGVLWPTSKPWTLTFRAANRNFFISMKHPTAPIELWELLGHSLLDRNRQLGFKSPLPDTATCPKCGKEFIPHRKGQVFDTRKCADSAGQMRRRKGQKQTKDVA